MTYTERDVIASGPLTYGQASTISEIADLPGGGEGANIIRRVTLDAAVPLVEIHEAIFRVVQLHSSLRTVIKFDGIESASQNVVRNAALPVAECGPEDYGSAVAALRSYDLQTFSDLMWKIVLKVEEGMVGDFAIVIHHAICDGRGIEAFQKHIRQVLAGLTPNRDAITQSIDLANLQRSPKNVDRARRYFSRIFAEMPPSKYPDWRTEPEDERFRYAAVFPAIASSEDVRNTAESYEVSSHTILLALSTLIASSLSGSRTGTFNVLSDNRTSPPLRETIDCLTQEVPLMYSFETADSFRALCRRVHQRAMRAYTLGPWDIGDIGELQRAAEARRGASLYIGQFFNYQQTSRGLAAPGGNKRPEVTRRSTGPVFYVKVSDHAAVDVNVIASPHLATEGQVAALGSAFSSCLAELRSREQCGVGTLVDLIDSSLTGG
ncbi:condensation domain-containing protein [Nonomuraea africana]|uniref:condensation domain-containing protein n=1 Tax=Nonomuraea africana TaxID=46171 RepID=UPI0033EB400B